MRCALLGGWKIWNCRPPKTAELSYFNTRKLNLIWDNLSCLNNICPAKPRGVYKKEESYTIHGRQI